ncbi:sirohydrochlorin chelatase [Streptomyces pactum]|uniref:sirohydrochlorin chelatase n=1 Tax=Streptomyces pactum TaxID=68249 RepID=UPI0036F932DE
MTAPPHPAPAAPYAARPRPPADPAGARPGAAPGRPAPPGRRRPAPVLVAVAHGSHDPRALRTVTALLARVRALRPGLPVRLGHLGIDRPPLADTLATLRGEAVLVPLLFSRGHHVKRDLPALAAAALAAGADRGLVLRTARPLGPHPLLAEALHARLAEAGWPDPAPPGAGVVLAAAGSRDPESGRDTAATAALLSRRLGGVPVLPGYASAGGPDAPTVAGAVRALTALGRTRIAVASCFVAPGWFPARCAAAAPGTAAAPLGDHPALARLVLHRYTEALTGIPAGEPVTVGA